MKPLIKRIQQAVILFQIQRIDRRYIRLNRDLDWYDQALRENKDAASASRRTLLEQRTRLSMKFFRLENN
jgi:hypothetical protein